MRMIRGYRGRIAKGDCDRKDAVAEDRIAALGRFGSCPEIIADLNSLTETEIEYDGNALVAGH